LSPGGPLLGCCPSLPALSTRLAAAKTDLEATALEPPSPPTSSRSDRFDLALTRFAEPYIDQNERDYEALAAA
jgi:hypothetical protein